MGISVDDLRAAGLDDRFEAIEDAVGDHLEGDNANVAVISEPFAGRDVLLDYAQEFLGAATRRITFDAVVRGALPDLDTHEVILVDNCQYLYTREIGGFDPLDRFLAAITTSDALFVTSWNRYAWQYLDTVREVDRYFPRQIDIPALSADQVADLLTSNYGPDLPEFVETEAGGRVKTIGFDTHEVPLWGDWSVGLPVPELNLEYVRFRFLSDVEEDTQAVVFQKIATLSAGDPGIATWLWERSVRDGEIAPAYVEEVEQSLDLDHDAAFVLEIIVSKEHIARAELDRIVDIDPIDEPLQSLVHQGAVTIETIAADEPTGRTAVGQEGEMILDDTIDDDVIADAKMGAAGTSPEMTDDPEAPSAAVDDDPTDPTDVAEAEPVPGLDEPAADGSAPPATDVEADGGSGDPETREVVRIVPELLHASVRHLRGRQLIW